MEKELWVIVGAAAIGGALLIIQLYGVLKVILNRHALHVANVSDASSSIGVCDRLPRNVYATRKRTAAQPGSTAYRPAILRLLQSLVHT